MKVVKMITSLVLALLCVLPLVGCAAPAATNNPQSSAVPEAPAAEPAAPASEPTQPATEPTAVKPVLLAISFGTSFNDSRDITIGAVENALQAAFPDYEVRRAFTSQIIIDVLKERDGLEIDNVKEAMDRLIADGVKEVLIQPTHVMSGFEYDDVVAEVMAYAAKFDSFKFSKTLLTTDEDYQKLITVITDETKEYNTDGTAIVFMGHGTEHKANATYAKLQKMLTEAGFANYFVGTVEASPSLDDVIAAVTASGAKKVVLTPLMIVAGDHANNDMASDEPDSWKSAFKVAGFEVECVIKGLGQYEGVQQMIVEHAKAAAEGTAPAAQSAPTAALDGSRLNDGTYTITVTTSSSMFNIVDAQLTVANGQMTALLTMSGKGYGKLYMGTGEKALADSEDNYILAETNANDEVTFTVPVSALDTEIECAAWSNKKSEWYDRTILFESASLPAEAIKAE